MSFTFSKTNKLTKKQEQTLKTVGRMCLAFYDRDKKLPRKWENVRRVPRTWGDIKRLSGLSVGVLSKHLRTLISQDVVRVEKKLDEKGRMKTFYLHTGKPFTIEGKIGQTEIQAVQIRTERGTRTAYTFVPKKDSKQPSVLDVGRVYFDKDGVKGVEWKISKKGKPTVKDSSGYRKDRYLVDRVRPNSEDSVKS